jgi:twinkle protein
MIEDYKKVLEQGPCPKCSSSDGYTIWEKMTSGVKKIDAHCFSCRYSTNDPYGTLSSPTPDSQKGFVEDAVNPVASMSARSADTSSKAQIGLSVEDGLSHPIRAIPDRMISHATAEHFGVRIGVSSTDGETPIYTLFPRYRNGELVDWKKRTADKKFFSSGESDIDLFGSNVVKPQGKKLWITEGEYDAMSLYQALKEGSTLIGWEPPVVSLPDGIPSALKCLTRQQDLIDGYDELVLVFDNDTPGKEGRDAVCKAFAGKVSYVTLPLKDANEMLLQGRSNDLKWQALSHAKKYQPDGIVNAKDLWERYNSTDIADGYAYPDSMPELQEKLMLARPGTIVTVTSGSGCGKTQFLRELQHHFYRTTDEKIAGMYLEEDVVDTMTGMMAIDLNKRISLPNIKVSEEEKRESFSRLFSSGRISLYDYFGGMDDSSLLSKLKYFAITGHKFIFLDHLSIVVSEYAAAGGERERIDTLMTLLAKFVKEFNVILFLVVHLRKGDNSSTPFEQGAVPALDDLRGSAALKQLSWDVIGLSRNQQHTNNYCANVTESTVLKCRFTGRTGTCDYLYFNEMTGRMVNVDKPANYREPKGRRGLL